MRAPEGYSCKSNGDAFGKNTLPCNRDIWEARTTKNWMFHYDRYLSTKDSDAHLIGNDLVELDLTKSGYSAPNPDLLRWCEGLDSLGTLVWMVLPLHRYRLEQHSLKS